MSIPAGLVNKVEDLTDLEFAVLLCLIAKEHCLIDTPASTLDDLANELILISRDIFGLSHAVIDCTNDTSEDEFYRGILQCYEQETLSHVPRTRECSSKNLEAPQRTCTDTFTRSHGRGRVVNIIIAKNFDRISQSIQIQTLENEHIFVSHYHDPSIGLVNLEGDDSSLADERGSLSSVLRKSSSSGHLANKVETPLILEENIDFLRTLTHDVTISTEVYCYLENIINFLRFNRAVFSGITAPATRQFHKIVKCLAPLHGVDYVPPSLVALATTKIYRHRISVARPQDDRSMMYGSDINAVETILSDATPESIIEDVLAEVEAPL
ncbi:conserved hypothetical protein [Microsporum canis CBS 113480]|uniref:Magnesium chelatase n=1 Tax=Arthroderma otae (strain ATCC MYA-4605 / CBS 113480) TaxID=554155 RepID=C5FMR5_ARTOC|nr:conserved hypothetical protein [Microsporum canis CBS 113480]EEQ31168.1 conserved hypothetical protein [Microsporum canis CBS 113480]